MKIQQISSASFLWPGVWVATVTSKLQLASLNRVIFMSEKIIKIIILNGFVSFLFYSAAIT